METSYESESETSYESDISLSYEEEQPLPLYANCNYHWIFTQVTTENGLRSEKSYQFVCDQKCTDDNLLQPSFYQSETTALASLKSMKVPFASMGDVNVAKMEICQSPSEFPGQKYKKRVLNTDVEKRSPKMNSRNVAVKTNRNKISQNKRESAAVVPQLNLKEMKLPQQSFIRNCPYFLRSRCCDCPCHKGNISSPPYQLRNLHDRQRCQQNAAYYKKRSTAENRQKKSKIDQKSNKRRKTKFFVDDKSYSDSRG